jgi:hypothetical protein
MKSTWILVAKYVDKVKYNCKHEGNVIDRKYSEKLKATGKYKDKINVISKCEDNVNATAKYEDRINATGKYEWKQPKFTGKYDDI